MTTVLERPAFPQTVADLQAWSVYADQLLEQGDPLGEYVSRELSLVDPSPEQLEAFHELGRRLCRVRREFEAAWSLGHARSLSFHVKTPSKFSHTLPRVPDESFAALRQVLGKERVVLEQLTVPVMRGMVGDRLFAKALRELPASCRRLELSTLGLSATDAQGLMEIIPPQIAELRVNAFFAPFIDDRFSLIDLRPARLQPVALSELVEAMGQTSRARLRVGNLADASLLEPLGPRVELGGPDDAQLLEQGRKALVLLERPSLMTLQRRAGVVTIRAQLGRTVTEAYGLMASQVGVWAMPFKGSALVRDGLGQWSVRAEAYDGPRWGMALRQGTGHEQMVGDSPLTLQSGDQLRIEERVFTFTPPQRRPPGRVEPVETD